MRSTALLMAALAGGALACRTALPPPVQPFTPTPDAAFRREPPAPWQEPDALAAVDVQSFTLANGVAVYVVERPDVPLVSLAYVNRVGELERGEPAGLATLTARLLLEDTRLADGAQVSEIQIGGVRPTARVGYSGTVVGFTLVSSGTRVALEALASIVERPVFDARKLGVAQVAIGNDLFDDSSTLYGLGNVLTARAALGAEHPWSADLKAQARSLAGLKIEDVRAFYARRYRPEQSALVVAGAVSRAELEPLIERSFGSWQPAAPAARQAPAPAVAEIASPAPIESRGDTRKVYALLSGGDQAYVVLPQPTVQPGHPDYAALELVWQVLAGGYLSRANLSLRHESGISYGVSTDVVGGGRDAYVCIRSAVPQPRLRQGIQQLDAVLERLQREPVSERELADARSTYLAHLGVGTETPGGTLALVAGLFLTRRSQQDLRALADAVRGATAADLQRAAQHYLRPRGDLVVFFNYLDYGNQLTGLGRTFTFTLEKKRR